MSTMRSEFAHAARVTRVSVLSASIAHEVNQPLASIITSSEATLRWLARSDPDLEEIRELAKRVIFDAQRAAEIIDRIHVMVTQRAPKRTLLSLNNVVQESMGFLREELVSKSTSVALDLAGSLPQIFADRTQLQQVIVNLTINAVQAMTESGAARRDILIRTMLLDSETMGCIVEDSGPGIGPAHIPRLFESFFTTKDAGMGLGLSISRSIIEAHGGRIRANNDSTMGGARFSFTLPLIPKQGCCTAPAARSITSSRACC